MAGKVQGHCVEASEHFVEIVMVPAPAMQGQNPGPRGPVTCAPQAPTGESAERHKFRPKDYSPIAGPTRHAAPPSTLTVAGGAVVRDLGGAPGPRFRSLPACRVNYMLVSCPRPTLASPPLSRPARSTRSAGRAAFQTTPACTGSSTSNGAPASPEELVADLTPAQHKAVTAPSPDGLRAGLGRRRQDPGPQLGASGTAPQAGPLTPGTPWPSRSHARPRASCETVSAGFGLASPVTAGTFHSLAMSQLRRWWADRRAPEPALLERKGRLIAELVAGRPGLKEVGVGELASQLEWAKARLVEPSAFAAAAGAARAGTAGRCGSYRHPLSAAMKTRNAGGSSSTSTTCLFGIRAPWKETAGSPPPSTGDGSTSSSTNYRT